MHDAAAADLQRSGIAPADAEKVGMFSVDNAREIDPALKPWPALVITYFDLDGEVATFDDRPFYRLRYYPPERRGFAPYSGPKYVQPPRSPTLPYLPPLDDWRQIAADADRPLMITEGEKKTLAGRLAGFSIVGLGGVFNFTGSDRTSLEPTLAAFKWAGRQVVVAFDSDAETNPAVLTAEARIVHELQTVRGARCRIVRLPQHGEAKVGIDDYLVEHGPDALVRLCEATQPLGGLDAKVIALNRHVAWIERENMVYDLNAHLFLGKDAFLAGSRYSTLTHIGQSAKARSGPKVISVAKTWLTHPHAQRYSEALFRPGEGLTVQGEHGLAMNLWTGWQPGEGDVRPFLELSEFLFGDLPPEHRELPLRLLAHKAQHPADKIPLALVLLGSQGSGKTLWAECIRDAFTPYGVSVSSKAFTSDFQGWLEQSLIAVINEAAADDMRAGAETLKSLISDMRQPMNEKYRPARQINSYTMYILVANKRDVGEFDADDRRMIVVPCPPKREKAFYDRIIAWRRAGGSAALLGYLLRYDLGDWQPPAGAPMTAEKYMAYVESLTPAQRLAEEMRTAGEHTVKLWLDQAVAWAQVAEVGNDGAAAREARVVLDTVGHIQIRPWYSPQELALIFPSITQSLQSRGQRLGAGALSRQLRDSGVPYLQCSDDPRGFHIQGTVRQYLVVAEFDDWREPVSQADFERLMKVWPRYGAARR